MLRAVTLKGMFVVESGHSVRARLQ